MADRWKMLKEELVRLQANAKDEVEYETLRRVAEFMDQLERATAVDPSPHPEADYVGPWTFTEAQVLEWAAGALNGAPQPLVELCAHIAWSVLQGSNPNLDERRIHADSIRAVAGLFDNNQAAQLDAAPGFDIQVTSGIVG